MTPYERLHARCTKSGTTVTAFCNELKKSKGNLSTWKKGNFSVADLKAIRDRFNISADWLLFGDSTDSIVATSSQEGLIEGNSVDFDLSKNYGVDYLEKVFKEFNEKQRLYAITWIVGYAKSEGIKITF